MYYIASSKANADSRESHPLLTPDRSLIGCSCTPLRLQDELIPASDSQRSPFQWGILNPLIRLFKKLLQKLGMNMVEWKRQIHRQVPADLISLAGARAVGKAGASRTTGGGRNRARGNWSSIQMILFEHLENDSEPVDRVKAQALRSKNISPWKPEASKQATGFHLTEWKGADPLVTVRQQHPSLFESHYPAKIRSKSGWLRSSILSRCAFSRSRSIPISGGRVSTSPDTPEPFVEPGLNTKSFPS